MAAAAPRSSYSSLSTLGRSQYPTLPASNGTWTPHYPTLARSPSAGGRSDSVFLDGAPEDAAPPPASPGRYCKDPTYGSQEGELETDGPNGFLHPPPHLHHSLPRRSHVYQHNHVLPGGCHFQFQFRLILLLLLFVSNPPAHPKKQKTKQSV